MNFQVCCLGSFGFPGSDAYINIQCYSTKRKGFYLVVKYIISSTETFERFFWLYFRREYRGYNDEYITE